MTRIHTLILIACALLLAASCTTILLTPGGAVVTVSVHGGSPAVDLSPTPTQEGSTPEPPTVQRACNRNTGIVNVRVSPSINATITERLQPGQCEVILASPNDWHWLCFGWTWQPEYGCTKTGYVASWVVREEG